MKWHLEQCKNLTQELYKEPSQGASSENLDLLCLLFYDLCYLMNTNQTQQRLAFTLFCLVLVLTVYVGVITACEFRINIPAVVDW